MLTRTLILLTLAMFSFWGCRTTSASEPQPETPVAAQGTPSPSVTQHTATPTERTKVLEITPSGIPGLFTLSDSFAKEQPLWIYSKGGGPFLNTRPQYADKHQIMLQLRSETTARLVSLNPSYRMADGRGAGSEVGEFLSDFRMLNGGGVESIDGIKSKPGIHAIFWLVPRESTDTESRFGLVLEKELHPSSFADENEIKMWSQSDEETLRTEKVLGFIYLLEVKE